MTTLLGPVAPYFYPVARSFHEEPEVNTPEDLSQKWNLAG